MKNLNISPKASLSIGTVLIIIGLIVGSILDLKIKLIGVADLYSIVLVLSIILLGIILTVKGFIELMMFLNLRARQIVLIILIGITAIWITTLLSSFLLFRYFFLRFSVFIATITTAIWSLTVIWNIFKTGKRLGMVKAIAITSLIAGSLGLITALILVFFFGSPSFYWSSRVWIIIPIGWLLVFFGGPLISLRMGAYTSFSLGVYIFIFVLKFFEGSQLDAGWAGLGILFFMVLLFHVILGLFLGIASFLFPVPRKELRLK